jgi:BolA family transcriptional regulator, general stress-responsive regulator
MRCGAAAATGEAEYRAIQAAAKGGGNIAPMQREWERQGSGGSTMDVKDSMETKLAAALRPLKLVVIDESENHRGHGGWREGGQTHFRVEVVSEAFAGKSRVERHRMVNAVLADELAGGVHALAIRARAPGEESPTASAPAR